MTLPILTQFHHLLSAAPADGVALPKLVFLHGAMGFGANWRRIAKAFEADYQTFAYDQRGHGRSVRPLSGYGLANYAADLRDLMDALEWQSATIVGHSMGGRAALEFAFRHQKRVDRLVIEDIGPRMNPAAAGFLFELLDSVPVPFASKSAAREWFDSEFQRRWADHPKKAALTEFLYANIVEDQSKQGVWRFYEPGVRSSVAQSRAGDLWPQWESLRMPTLLVRGGESKDLPRDLFAEALHRNPLVRSAEIPGAGHWAHSDQPELFIDALRAFFADNPLHV